MFFFKRSIVFFLLWCDNMVCVYNLRKCFSLAENNADESQVITGFRENKIL